MNLYKTYSKGMALGSQCVICAKDEFRAKQIHYLETNYICENIELVQADIYMEVEGKPQTEYCFFSWNGDY